MNLTSQPIHEKPRKLTPREIAEGKEYIGYVKRLPCCICGASPPSDAHHPISGRYGTRKAPDASVIPLCKAHHQWGPEAIHNGKSGWEARHGPDTDYIEQTRKRVDRMKEDEILGGCF